MKAAIYARYSTDKQRDSSIADQFYNCERFADRQEYMVVARFEDKAITGAHRVRPGYQLMMQAAERGDFDVLIVDDLSRLSRDNIETQQVIREFKYRRQRVIAISDGFDSNDKSYKLQAGVRGIVNDIYIDDLRAKTHRGMAGVARSGKCTGGKAYGYRRKPVFDASRLDEFGRPLVLEVDREIDPDQAKWVQQIFAWFTTGYSPRKIAAMLNAKGVCSPRGDKWAPSAIYGDPKKMTGILNNELYIGKAVWNRREWVKGPDGKRRPIERALSELVVSERPDLRIISEELWHARCERMREVALKSDGHTNKRAGGAAPKYLFSGMLKCDQCDSNYSLVGKNLYGCSRHWNRGETACRNRLTVRKDVVESVLLSGIKDHLLAPGAMQEFLRECNALMGEMETSFAAERRQIEAQLRQIELDLKNLLAFIKSGQALPSIAQEIKKAEEDKRRLTLLLKNTPGTPAEIVGLIPRALERYREYVGKLSDLTPDMVPAAREQLKAITGDNVRMVPFEGDGLAAEVSGDYAALLGGHQLSVVAGARNGRYLMRWILKQPTGNYKEYKPALRLVV